MIFVKLLWAMLVCIPLLQVGLVWSQCAITEGFLQGATLIELTCNDTLIFRTILQQDACPE
jgi:hypothetical protein